MAGLSRRPLIKDEVDSVIAPHKERMTVQRVGLYYGSMLYFKMDREVKSTDNEGLRLTLEGDWWTLSKDGAEVCNSTSISREFAETVLTRLMRGESFLDFVIGSTATLYFSRGFSVVIKPDPSRTSDDYDLLLSLYLPENIWIVLTNDLPPQLAISH